MGPWLDTKMKDAISHATHLYHPGIHEPGSALSLTFNKQFWNSLSSHQQKSIELGCKAQLIENLALFTAKNAEYLGQAESNVTARMLPEEVMRALFNASMVYLDGMQDELKEDV